MHSQTVRTPTGNKDLELIEPRENARHIHIEAQVKALHLLGRGSLLSHGFQDRVTVHCTDGDMSAL